MKLYYVQLTFKSKLYKGHTPRYYTHADTQSHTYTLIHTLQLMMPCNFYLRVCLPSKTIVRLIFDW